MSRRALAAMRACLAIRACVVICACLAISACGGESLEHPGWIVPVPEGTRIVEPDPVPPGRRTGTIDLVEDPAVGTGVNPDARLYRPVDVAVSDGGDMYIADSGRHRVVVFDRQGEFLRTIGREGEGPGEFQEGSTMRVAVADDHLVVHDAGDLSVWSLDGELVDEFAMAPIGLNDLEPAGTDSVVVRYEHVSDVTAPEELVARHALDGRELLRYASVEEAGSPPYDESMNRWAWIHQAGLNRSSGPTLEIAVGPGAVYVSPLLEYQVVRMDPGGTVGWALRVAWPRPAFHEELIGRRLASLQKQAPGATRADIDWPDRRRALSGFDTDGHGHVHVFPTPDRTGETGVRRGSGGNTDAGIPVDVYSEDAAHLFSGYLSGEVGSGWAAARRDFVYSIRTSEPGGEYELVRYRLVEPF